MFCGKLTHINSSDSSVLPPTLAKGLATRRWLLPSAIVLLVAAAVAAGWQQWAASAIAAFVGLVFLSVEGILGAGVNRVGAALIVAPFTSCLVLVVVSPSEWWLLPAMVYAYFFGLLGIPAYFAFKSLGWLHFWQVVCAGATLSAAVELLLFGAERTAGVLLFSVSGALTSAVFWLLAFARLPRSTGAAKD